MSMEHFLANEADMEGGFIMTENTVSCNQKFKHADVVNISPPAQFQGDQPQLKIYYVRKIVLTSILARAQVAKNSYL